MPHPRLVAAHSKKKKKKKKRRERLVDLVRNVNGCIDAKSLTGHSP